MTHGEHDASTEEHDDPTRETGRRSFLRRSGAALFGVGLGAGRIDGRYRQGGESDPGGNGEPGGLDNIQMLLPADGPLKRDLFRDVILVTEPTEVRLNADTLRGCGDFLPSRPWNGYQGLVVDRQEIEQVFDRGDLQQLGPLNETDLFVSTDVDVRVGEPYVVTDGNYCEESYVTVTAHRLTEMLQGGTDEGDGGLLF